LIRNPRTESDIGVRLSCCRRTGAFGNDLTLTLPAPGSATLSPMVRIAAVSGGRVDDREAAAEQILRDEIPVRNRLRCGPISARWPRP